jgi:8-oxo-dGTP pyrophosphatase MutT (NUDIX family)
MLKVPAGKINDGEIDAEAVVREFQEELGASPVDIVFLDSLVNTTPSGDTYLIHSYLVLDVEGNVVNKEPKKTKHEWLTFNEAERRLELVDSILTLKLARDYLSEARRNKD